MNKFTLKFIATCAVLGVMLLSVGLYIGVNAKVWLGGLSEPIKIQEETDIFSAIEIDAVLDGSIKIIKSDKFAVDIEYEKRGSTPNYKIEGSTLKIYDIEMKKSLWDRITNKFAGSFKHNSIVVYVPELKSVKITAQMASVEVTDIDVDDMYIDSQMSNIKLNEVATKRLNISTQMGNINLNGNFYNFSIINTEIGNVKVKTCNSNYELNTGLGKVTVDGVKQHSSYNKNNGSDNTLRINTSLGNINLHMIN